MAIRVGVAGWTIGTGEAGERHDRFYPSEELAFTDPEVAAA